MSVQNQLKVVLIFFFLILFLCPAFGQEVAKHKFSGKLLEVKITSPSLKGNLLGDPIEQSIAV